MKTTLNDDSTPSKKAILDHLRNGGPHQGKHWQEWYIESWNVEQLYALHDDDHDGVVPVYDEPTEVLIVTVDHPFSSQTLLAAVSDSVLYSSSETNQGDVTYGSLFDVELDVSLFVPELLHKVMRDQQYQIPAAGLTFNWTGERSLSIKPDVIECNPPLRMTVDRYGIRATVNLSRFEFANDGNSVTVITDERLVPDFVIHFTSH